MAQGTEIWPDVYREAALERLTDVQVLYARQQYAAAIYAAGVAVECIFRAYRGRSGLPFDDRHELRELAKTSGYLAAVPDGERREFAANLSIVFAAWSNTHRYRSRADMLAFLKRQKLDRGIKGDVLKERCRQMQIAASGLVSLGERQWDSLNG